MKPAIVLGAFELDDLFELRQRVVSRVPAALNAVIRIENVDDAGDAGLGRPAARIAGQRDRARRAAVIRAIAREDLVAAGVPARDLDRVLVRLGAAVGEEEAVDVAGRDLGELGAQPRARLGGHERIGVGEHRRLFLDRANDALVAVADVDAHQLAVEVDEALAFGRPEVDALRARDGNRIDLRLRGPLEDRVLAARARRSPRRSSCCDGVSIVAMTVDPAAIAGLQSRARSAVIRDRALRLRNAPAPARPTNFPFSMMTLPREMHRLADALHLAPFVRVVVHLHVQRLHRQRRASSRD